MPDYTVPLERRRQVAELYGGKGGTPEQARAALASSPEAPAASANDVPAPPPGALKGAVKVSGFPDRSLYPFREIADDGGVWKLDAATFKAKPQSVRSAAWAWAKKNDRKTKVVIDGGFVYVQFRPAVDHG